MNNESLGKIIHLKKNWCYETIQFCVILSAAKYVHLLKWVKFMPI